MGLSIHYRGELKNADLIRPLTEEVADICNISNWKYSITAHSILEGISITPEHCETLTLTFLPNGKLASRIFIQLGEPDYAYIFIKTQYAGMDTHIEIIHIFRYLAEKLLWRF